MNSDSPAFLSIRNEKISLNSRKSRNNEEKKIFGNIGTIFIRIRRNIEKYWKKKKIFGS